MALSAHMRLGSLTERGSTVSPVQDLSQQHSASPAQGGGVRVSQGEGGEEVKGTCNVSIINGPWTLGRVGAGAEGKAASVQCDPVPQADWLDLLGPLRTVCPIQVQ